MIFCLKKKVLINIYDLFLLNCYKSYRHLFGLPCNGQRTWRNATTASKINNTLILFKEKKLFFLNKSSNFKKYFFIIEYLNFFFFKQWPHEWLAGRKFLKKNFKFKTYKKASINLASLARKNVPSFFKKVSKKKKII